MEFDLVHGGRDDRLSSDPERNAAPSVEPVADSVGEMAAVPLPEQVGQPTADPAPVITSDVSASGSAEFATAAGATKSQAVAEMGCSGGKPSASPRAAVVRSDARGAENAFRECAAAGLTSRSNAPERWGVLHSLSRSSDRNGQLVRVGEPRGDGRIVTMRPASQKDKIAVRPENLRILLQRYDGRAAGDSLEHPSGDVVLLGFDAAANRWAGELVIELGEGRREYQYLFIPEASLPE